MKGSGEKERKTLKEREKGNSWETI